MVRKLIVPLLLLLTIMLFPGCIYKAQQDLSSKLKLSFMTPIDVDSNGVIDIYEMGFSPTTFQAGETEVTVSRTLYIYPIDGVAEGRKDSVDNMTVLFLKSSIDRLSSKISAADADCKSKVNFDICKDEKTCATACISSTDCSESSGISGLLWDYKQIMDRRDEDIRALTLLVSALRDGDSLADVSSRLTKLKLELDEMANHPLIRELHFCSFSVDTSQWDPYIGVFYPSKNKGLVLTEVLANNINGAGLELNLQETIDSSIDGNVDTYYLFTDLRKVSSRPVVLQYPTLRMYEDGKAVFVYEAVGPLKREDTYYEGWNQLTVDLRIVTINLGWLNKIMDSFDKVLYTRLLNRTGDPKLALGISLALLWFLIVLFYEVSIYATRFFIILRMNKPIKYAYMHAFGYASPSWKWDLIIGILLAIIGYAVDVTLSTNVPLTNLNVDSLINFMSKDILGAVSIIILFASGFFISSVLVDRFKRLLAGSEYDELETMATPEKNEALWKELKHLIESGKEELKKAAEKEMDVGRELSKLLAIPMEDLREQIYNSPNQQEVMEDLKKYRERVEEILSAVRNKVQLAEKNRDEWIKYIDGKLTKSSQVPLDALVSIPIEWRLWAAKEYINTYPEKFVELNGVMLVKRTPTDEEKVDAFINHLKKALPESIGGIAVFKGEHLISSKLPSKKTTIIANLLAILNERRSTVGASKLLLMFDKRILYAEKMGSKDVFILTKKEDFEKLTSNIERLKKMLI